MLKKSDEITASPQNPAVPAGDRDESADIAAVLKGGRQKGRLRRFGWAALVLVVAGAGLWWTLGSGGGGPSVDYVTRPVTQGDLTVTVTATGTVEPTNEVSISSELSGTVRSVLVDYNDTVTAGEVLATLDTDKLVANVELSRATLAARQAEVAQAQATVEETTAIHERTSTLADKGFTATEARDTAKAAMDRAEAALAAAQANLQVAEANLSIAEADLAKAEITSPINGVVLSRDVEPGQIVAASFSAPELFTLAEDLSQMELQVDIDEADMSEVKTGDTATFTVEAFKGRTFPAEISQLRLSPETVEGVVTYKAILTVDNSDLTLRPGMTATADITVETVKDATLIPNAALRYAPPAQETESRGSGLLGLLMPRRPGNGQATVTTDADGRRQIWVLRDGAPAPVSVDVGPSDGTHTVVTGDLSAGEQVIVGSQSAP